MKLALHVITAAGYGYQFDWEASGEIPPGHELSFKDSIHVTLDNLVTLIAVPSSLLNLPIEHLRKTKQAYQEFGKYLQDLIKVGRNRRNTKIEDSSILGELISHSSDTVPSKDRPLRDDEIIGNAFIFLLAGHETT